MKVTSLKFLTHLITEYTELEEEDVQDINRRTKEPISSETLFQEFVHKNEWNQEAVAVQNPYSPDKIVSMAYKNIEKCGLYQDDSREWSRKPKLKKTGATSRLTFLDPSRMPKYHQGPQIPKYM